MTASSWPRTLQKLWSLKEPKQFQALKNMEFENIGKILVKSLEFVKQAWSEPETKELLLFTDK